mmetsp:Transcript_11911/g.37870  ORF Transcript_11911/g.37870 Transcript_11911/m.37870 type:complete len:306 (+) Transcript_11911:179-1096(+)
MTLPSLPLPRLPTRLPVDSSSLVSTHTLAMPTTRSTMQTRPSFTSSLVPFPWYVRCGRTLHLRTTYVSSRSARRQASQRSAASARQKSEPASSLTLRRSTSRLSYTQATSSSTICHRLPSVQRRVRRSLPASSRRSSTRETTDCSSTLARTPCHSIAALTAPWTGTASLTEVAGLSPGSARRLALPRGTRPRRSERRPLPSVLPCSSCPTTAACPPACTSSTTRYQPGPTTKMRARCGRPAVGGRALPSLLNMVNLPGAKGLVPLEVVVKVARRHGTPHRPQRPLKVGQLHAAYRVARYRRNGRA